MENSCNLWVHIDELVALDSYLLVSLVHGLFNPKPERLANDAVCDVTDIGPFKPEAFFWWRESVFDGLGFESKLEDIPNC